MLFRDRPELLEPFRRGERAALEAVYRTYVKDVTRMLRLGFVSGEQGARVPGLADVALLAESVQEVFTRALMPAARASYDAAFPYRPFLLRIARNLRIDQMRRGTREVVLTAVSHEADAPIDIDALIQQNGALPERDPRSLEDRLAWEQLTARTREYVQGLDTEAQTFVELRFVAELSQAEVAERMGVTRRRVRTLEDELQAGLARALAQKRTR